MFGKPDLEDKYTIQEEVSTLVIKGLQNLLQSTENAILPLKILQNLYMEHENLIEITLGKISVCFVEYIVRFLGKNSIEKEYILKNA